RVLQHIEPDLCRAYLGDFARMAPTIYLLTRSRSDFDVNTCSLIELDLFEAGECVEVDHDSETHQLRVLRRGAVDDPRQAADDRHYEVLLRVPLTQRLIMSRLRPSFTE